MEGELANAGAYREQKHGLLKSSINNSSKPACCGRFGLAKFDTTVYIDSTLLSPKIKINLKQNIIDSQTRRKIMGCLRVLHQKAELGSLLQIWLSRWQHPAKHMLSILLIGLLSASYCGLLYCKHAMVHMTLACHRVHSPCMR